MLIFGYEFNADISNVIWPQLTHLEFDGWFNQSINSISESLVTLRLGRSFNQPINIKLPHLENLIFGHDFNQKIDDIYMPKVIYLTFGRLYAQDISNVKFDTIYIITDYSCEISIDSCKFPHTLHKIIHLYPKDDVYMPQHEKYGNFTEDIAYHRILGQHTKAAYK
jgi:hypothetical protein